MYSEAEEAREGDYPSLRVPFLADRLAAVRSFLGGAPATVLSKLALLSVAVGGLLSSIRFNPVDLFYGMVRAANSAFGIAAGIVVTLVQYLLIGLIVVAPIWLILRWYSFRQERTAAADAAE
ncbi:MAG: hypothetical protein U1E56_08460 [Bauldia sp.]